MHLADSSKTSIEVRGLSKKVMSGASELMILDDINFAVERGSSIAIVGKSGSGKSTLLSLLAGLDLPTAGMVELDGVSIFSLDEDARAAIRRDKVGFVFQSFQLLSHLTALENVMLPLELRGDRSARKQAEAMLARVGLTARLSHTPKTLSGGEQQRVALARAFVTRPSLIFADEPTGSLDAGTGDAVMTLIFELGLEYQATIVMVTHDNQIARRCESVLTVAAGKIISHRQRETAIQAHNVVRLER